MTDTINLAAFLPSETIPFEIMQPGSRKGTGWVLQLAGPGHENAVSYSNAQVARDLARAAAQETARLNGKTVVVDERTPEEIKTENVGWITCRVVGWNPVVIPFIDASAPTEYSAAMAVRVFSHPMMGWAFKQLVEKLNDEVAFTQRSAKD